MNDIPDPKTCPYEGGRAYGAYYGNEIICYCYKLSPRNVLNGGGRPHSTAPIFRHSWENECPLLEKNKASFALKMEALKITNRSAPQKGRGKKERTEK